MGEEDTIKYVQVNDHNIEEVKVVLIPTKEHGSPEGIAAKNREMDTFKHLGLYQEVEDQGQIRLSSCWIMTDN